VRDKAKAMCKTNETQRNQDNKGPARAACVSAAESAPARKTAGRGQKGAKARSGVSINGFRRRPDAAPHAAAEARLHNIFARDYAG